MIKLSIIIVAWNTKEYSVQCLDSVFIYPPTCEFEVIYVDNCSQDGSVGIVRRLFSSVRIIQNERNIGFPKANNQAIRIAQGEYILLLNSDTVALDGSIDKLLNFMEDTPKVGAASGKCLYPDGRKQWTISTAPSVRVLFKWMLGRYGPSYRLMSRFMDIGKGNSRREPSEPVEQDYPYGAFLIARREAVEQVGLIDEKMFTFGEDLDWGVRMRKKGWKVFYVPDAQVIHYQGQTTKKDPKRFHIEWLRAHRYFFSKYKSLLYCSVIDSILIADIMFMFLKISLGSLINRRNSNPVFKSRDDCLGVLKGAFSSSHRANR